MHRFAALSRVGRLAGIVVVMLLCLLLAGVQGCKPRTATTSTEGLVESTGTVQTTSSVDSSQTASDESARVGQPGAWSESEAADALEAEPGPATSAGWPVKVGQFAKGFSGPIWYPKNIPAGFKTESIDSGTIDGGGPMCIVVFTLGEKSIGLDQGSPKSREAKYSSLGKVPWGTETADLVREDPEEPGSLMIVYSKGGNLAELYGDVDISQLKAMAASMVLVK